MAKVGQPVFVVLTGLLFLAGSELAARATTNSSSWAFLGTSGRMVRQPDALGNRVLDYSGVGYKGGTVPIPDVTIKTNISPVAGDNGASIQAAINYVATLPLDTNGFRGAVLLSAGEYQISNSITINVNGIVLRGVGDGSDTNSNTILRATSVGTNHPSLVIVSGSCYVHYTDCLAAIKMDRPARATSALTSKPAATVAPLAPLSDAINPQAVLTAMQRVADWQLANPSKHKPTDWKQGAGYAGIMALADISGDTKYRDAMVQMGEKNQWALGPRPYHADDHCVGQTYAELFFQLRDPKMLGPLRARFDEILAKPHDGTLQFRTPGNQDRWSWCDALFMAPPAWVRLYSATGDKRYLDFAVTNWWRTSDYLYDQDEHLYFRDSTYFEKREANGKKVFWGRGNGWVMGGLVRTLQYLPDNHPAHARFEQQFKDMSSKLLTCQADDGLWRASLLDPASYPLKETSSSGFYTYAFAWGVNQGLLDRATFEPAVRKAWAALIACVQSDGKLTHVQPSGADPKKFDDNATEVYGVGAFLLAGSEVYRLAAVQPRPGVTFESRQPRRLSPHQ